MTTTLLLSFPWGRYHATPWGRHVNEGAVELPPSPWRLLRSLYAVWRTRLPQLPEDDVHDLLAGLAVPPVFFVPRHTISHTRHYYPDSTHSDGAASTDRTLDAFAVFERGAELAIRWPADLPTGHADLLGRLAAALPYFGRAESLCEASVATGWEPDGHHTWVPVDVADEIPPDAHVTSVLGPELPLRVESLTARPVDVRRHGLLFPLGTRLVGYQRLDSPARPATRPATRPARQVTAVRLSILQAATPAQTDALVYTDLLRQAALSKLGQPLDTSMLAGKTATGQALDHQHTHAHYLPMFGDQRLRDLVVWAPRGLSEEELKALTSIRRLHSSVNQRWRLTVRTAGVGRVEQVAPELVGPARTWESALPFTPSRYPSRNAVWPEFLADEIARELGYRGLPAPVSVDTVPGDWAAFRRYRPTARQRHDTRQGQAGPPGAFLRLTFAQPVTGPVVMGRLSHFGLGLFLPEG
ncbi:MAG TPA: type I-U CRISPR-associated protein Csb2 [Pseudonocardiaceae bacterium]|nr:type I-U CRISPR-associated protein Csb2 [Pseudonocardiaceae bacterium]